MSKIAPAAKEVWYVPVPDQPAGDDLADDAIAFRYRQRQESREVRTAITAAVVAISLVAGTVGIIAIVSIRSAKKPPAAVASKSAADPRPIRPIIAPSIGRGGPRAGDDSRRAPPTARMEPLPIAPPPTPEPIPEPSPERIRFTPSEPRPAAVSFPGYYTRKLSGFTVHISKMAYESSDSAQGQPLGCLEAELARLKEIFPVKYLKLLATVPVWVEWDHTDRRDPNVIAVYYGERGEGLLFEGIDPRKAKSITVLSLKAIYDRKAAGKMKKTVLLHELAHAVHGQIFGFDNAFIENAYAQAMARELYHSCRHADGEFRPGYAAKNSAEYFADLSCAYFDTLDYFPRTSDELRRHDSVGFEIMEKAWGSHEQIHKEKRREQK